MVADLAPTPRGAPAVEDLLLWKDPKKSGVCLAACTGAYMLFEKSGFTLISLLCNIFLVFTCTAFLWANIAPMMNKGVPAVPKLDVSEDQIKRVGESITKGINSGLSLAHRIGTGKDIKLSLMVAGALFLASKVGACMNFLTLCFTVVVLFFSVPKAYEMRQAEADKYAALATAEATKYYGIAQEKAKELVANVKGRIPAKAAPAEATKKEE